MTLVDDIPLTREARRRRTARYLRITGALLLCLGAMPVASNIDVLFVLAVLGGPILPLLCVYVLLSIARGRTSIVVYLRRFGRSSSNMAVAQALESGLGRGHRIVTLDDSRFVPLEVPKWERRVSRYGPPLLATTMILAFVLTVRALRQQGDVLFLWLSMGSVPLVAISLWSVCTAFFLLLIHRRRIRQLARGRLTSEHDLTARAASLVRLSSWSRVMGIAAPQATVLGVDDVMWQTTVAMLVRDCSAVLIDLSEPTANLAWELDTVLRQAGNRVVFIGDRTAVVAWRNTVGSQSETAASRRISVLLGEQTILAYDTSDRRGRRRLRRSLLRALDNVALPVSTAASQHQRAPGWFWLSAARTFGAYLLAPVLAAALSGIAVTISSQLLGDLITNSDHPVDRLMPPEAVLRNRGVPMTPEALIRSAGDGRPDDLTRLLEAGVKPDEATEQGWTALHLAAATGNIAALTALLQTGVGLTARTDDGRSVLFLAAAGGHTAAIRALAAAGAAVNVVADRRTALGLVIQLGDIELVRLLLDRGADVATPHLGMSPVVLAATMGRADILDALIARGAAVDVRSEYGHSPLDLAAMAGCRECTAGLIAAGAIADARVSLVASSASPVTPGSVPERRRPHGNLAFATTSDVAGLAVVSALTGATAGSTPRAAFVSAERLEIQRQSLLRGTRRPGLDLRGTYLEFSTPERHISLCVPASDAHLRKAFMAGLCRADVLLIVTAGGDDEARLEEHVKWARHADVPNLLIVVASGPGPDSGELRSMARAMLAKHGYETASIVRVSLPPVDEEQESASPMDELSRAIDHISLPVRAADAPFLMVVEDVIPRRDKTGIVTGRVEAGVVRIGDEVEVIGSGITGRARVASIESYRRLLDSAVAGANVGIIMDNNMTAERGQIITKPGSVRAHAQFDAEVYMLSPAEGGRLAPIADGYRPSLSVRTALVTATLTLRHATSGVKPGEAASARIQLLGPVAMAPGQPFELREGGRVVGCGVVTRVF
jgi:elongation factor Tu